MKTIKNLPAITKLIANIKLNYLTRELENIDTKKKIQLSDGLFNLLAIFFLNSDSQINISEVCKSLNKQKVHMVTLICKLKNILKDLDSPVNIVSSGRKGYYAIKFK